MQQNEPKIEADQAEEENAIKFIKQGAEAKLYVCEYLGKPTLIKERFVKTYRNVELDANITKERIKQEARAIVRCKAAAVKTPTLYLVDFDRRQIYMEYFPDSITVKDYVMNLRSSHVPPEINEHSIIQLLATWIGSNVRKLHMNNIIHGDLTTSNMLLTKKIHYTTDLEMKWAPLQKMDLVFIDFGLAHTNGSVEDKAVDLYVLERAINSTHNDCPEFFHNILTSYKNYKKLNLIEIMNKFDEVRARGRKRTMVG